MSHDNLAEAAQALAQAAVKHTQATSLSLSKEAVDELKQVNEHAKALSEKMDKLEGKVAVLPALEAKVAALATKLDALTTVEQDAKWVATVQTLQWAITNAERFSFTLDGSTRSSTKIVVEVLGTFIQGMGLWLSNEYMVGGEYNRTRGDAERSAFREKLSTQIHQLTGVKPRLEERTRDGVKQFLIFRV